MALKELGLSLEQIGPLLKNEISPAELRAMLTMKRAQLEQSLREEEARLRHIESRIAQIDRAGDIGEYDVVVKSVAATPLLSLRCACENMDEAARMVRTVAEDGTRLIRPSLRGKLIVVARNDLDDEKLDLEIGFSLLYERQHPAQAITCCAPATPAVDTMATIVRPDQQPAIHRSARSACGSSPAATGRRPLPRSVS